MKPYAVGDVVKRYTDPRNRSPIGMVKVDYGNRVAVMTRYEHAVDGLILHTELWDKDNVELVVSALDVLGEG